MGNVPKIRPIRDGDIAALVSLWEACDLVRPWNDAHADIARARAAPQSEIFVVPDILANAGGVTVSYFEWVQNLQELLWSEQEVSERLDRILKQAFAETLKIAEEKKVHMRAAAYILGVGRVVKAMTLRGIYP